MTAKTLAPNTALWPQTLRSCLLVTALAALAGCAQHASIRAGQPLPVAPATSTTVATAPTVVLPSPAPVASTPLPSPAVPVTPSGPLDARSGLHQASVVSISGSADSHFTVMLRPALTEPSRINAAPAQLCQQAGRSLKSSKTNTPGTSSAMPGIQMMIVECSAA